MYKIPITTQHDARQRCPALTALKEENNNNNNNNNNNKATRCLSWTGTGLHF